jgi:hypothetical protein
LDAGEKELALSMTGGNGVVYTDTFLESDMAFPIGLDAIIWRLYVFAMNGIDAFPVLLMVNIYVVFPAVLETPELPYDLPPSSEYK